MLARPYESRYHNSWIKTYVNPKLDGERALWYNNKLWSRSGKEIVAVPHIVEELRAKYLNRNLDGELYFHGRSFQEIHKSVGRKVNVVKSDIQYWIFDVVDTTCLFENRLNFLRSAIKESDFIKLCPARLLEKGEDINPYGETYEGSMLRNSKGLYVHKRSKDLLKVKSFLDAEFEIVGTTQLFTKDKILLEKWEPGALRYTDGRYYRNGNKHPEEMIGSLICKINDSTFEVGTGFDHETRNLFWKNPPIGQFAKIKYQELTDDGKPRFPIFITLRDREDFE